MSGAFGFNKADSESVSTSRPVDLTPGEFANLRSPYADVLKGLLSGGQSNPIGGIPTYTGPFTAAVTPGEQTNLDRLQAMFAPGPGSRQGLITDTISGKYLDPASNPFLSDYIKMAQRPTMEALTETLSRELPGRFTAGGQFVQPQGSSAFDRAAALASRSAANAIGDIATKISTGAYEAERGRQTQAVQLGQQEVQTVINNLQAQGLPRLIEQYGIDKGVEEFRNRLNALIQILGVTGSATKVNVANASQGTSDSHAFGFTASGGVGGSGSGAGMV